MDEKDKEIADLFWQIFNSGDGSYTVAEKQYIKYLLEKGLDKSDISAAVRFRDGFTEGFERGLEA